MVTYDFFVNPALPSDFNIANGENVTVSNTGNTYTISATDTLPDVNKNYVDSEIANVTANIGGELSAHAAMPSDHYEELTNPGNNGIITALADGYITVMGVTTSDRTGIIGLARRNENQEYYWTIHGKVVGYPNQGLYPWTPVSKGETIVLICTDAQVNKIYFIYANGSVPASPNP